MHLNSLEKEDESQLIEQRHETSSSKFIPERSLENGNQFQFCIGSGSKPTAHLIRPRLSLIGPIY